MKFRVHVLSHLNVVNCLIINVFYSMEILRNFIPLSLEFEKVKLNYNNMNEIPQCPKCGSEYTYFDGSLYVCPDCSYEFNSVDEVAEADDVARDSNGAELFDGDAVTVIKDLKVKGSSMVIKRGTKVKSIRLTENPEEVDCKIDGSSIVLKTCFLKK